MSTKLSVRSVEIKLEIDTLKNYCLRSGWDHPGCVYGGESDADKSESNQIQGQMCLQVKEWWFLWEGKGGRGEELDTPKLRLEMLQNQNFSSPEILQVETFITDMLKEHSLRTLFI